MGLSKAERRKDTVQVIVEAGATHAGRAAGIVAGAVRDVTRELGDFATEVFEIREASKRAAADAGEFVEGDGAVEVDPVAEPELEPGDSPAAR